MKLLRTLIPALVLSTLAAQLAADATRALEPGDIFALQYASEPNVDSSGQRILYLRNTMDIMKDRKRSNLWVVNADGTRHRPITSGALTISSPAIAPDDNRVAYVSRDDTGAQIFMHWLDTGHTAQLTRLSQKPGNLRFSPDGKWLAFTMLVPESAPTMGTLPSKPKGAEWAAPPVIVDRMIYRGDGRGNQPHGHKHIFIMPADGGSPRQVTQGDFVHDTAPSWSPDGNYLYFSANRNKDWEIEVVNTEIYRLTVATGEIKALTARKGPDRGISVSPNGKQLAYLGFNDRDMGYHRARLYVMNADGSASRELLPELDRSIANLNWSADGQQLFFQYDDKGNTLLASTDMNGSLTVHARDLGGMSLGRPYSGADYAIGGKDQLAFTLGSTASPADIATIRPGQQQPTALTQLNANLLSQRDLAPVEELWLQSSADKLDIQAWIATPPDFDPGKKYPLLLEIHGGPFTNYGFRFSAEVQLYAAAGYVVLYVNPRGSTSYGEDFANRIHHAYPGQDYDDLMSAVDKVIDKGYIDEDQLYVTGGSGGGVLTAWIVGKTPRFRAAVVAKPVINWASFVLTADMPPYFTRYWFAKMPWEDPMDYWQRSPLSLVGEVSTPTMLLTGEADLRTPISETEQYYQALKLRGIDTAMVRIPGASHSIASRPSQLLSKVSAVLTWFERYSGD